MAKFKDYSAPASGGGWMSLQEGSNRVRIVSEFDTFGEHYDNDKEQYAVCIGKDNDCIYCEQASGYYEQLKQAQIEGGENPNEEQKKVIEDFQKQVNIYKPKVKYLIHVIDRADGEIKLMKYGVMIQKKIHELSKSDDYGFDVMPNYDMTITRKGKGLDTEYDVIPARNDTDLTEKEQLKINELEHPEKIIEKMKSKLLRTINLDETDTGEEEKVPESDEKIPF